MLLSIYENEILTCSVAFSILSVNCSHVCIIYAKIYEKISSGGLEVSLSIIFIVCILRLYIYSQGTKVAYRAKTHIFCTRKVYGWNFVY